ncbi:hypothetical protein ACLKA7_013568 [Drosophila subpalustris]
MVAWPSGLRRWFKAPVSSEAEGLPRTPPLTTTTPIPTRGPTPIQCQGIPPRYCIPTRPPPSHIYLESPQLLDAPLFCPEGFRTVGERPKESLKETLIEYKQHLHWFVMRFNTKESLTESLFECSHHLHRSKIRCKTKMIRINPSEVS